MKDLTTFYICALLKYTCKKRGNLDIILAVPFVVFGSVRPVYLKWWHSFNPQQTGFILPENICGSLQLLLMAPVLPPWCNKSLDSAANCFLSSPPPSLSTSSPSPWQEVITIHHVSIVYPRTSLTNQTSKKTVLHWLVLFPTLTIYLALSSASAFLCQKRCSRKSDSSTF